jgi:hypothetical protein
MGSRPIDITITVLDIIHRQICYLKQDSADWILSLSSKTEINSVYWAQVSRFLLKTEIEASFERLYFK